MFSPADPKDEAQLVTRLIERVSLIEGRHDLTVSAVYRTSRPT
jgi:hypothetical protein